jgi:hypothetical protein
MSPVPPEYDEDEERASKAKVEVNEMLWEKLREKHKIDECPYLPHPRFSVAGCCY